MSDLNRLENSSSTRVKVIPRKTVGVPIKQDLLAKAREIDINLSKLLEPSFIQLVNTKQSPFL